MDELAKEMVFEGSWMTEMLRRPIALVTFDLYDTLVETDPPRWERFALALERAGMPTEVHKVLHADRKAEDHYTIENGRYPIRDRTPDEVQAFRLSQTEAYLSALDLPRDADTIRTVQRYFQDETQGRGWQYRPFDDVSPALTHLAEHGVKRAIISNADADVTNFCLHMGFAGQMDLIVTSALVGWEKPDPRTFFAALDPLGVAPEDALHIGDQALSDVKGARAIGMAAAIIDRYDRHQDDEHDAIRVNSLTALAELVVDHNDRVGAQVR
jgi:HAD superfamily hydrolase (TIGR01549 family)